MTGSRPSEPACAQRLLCESLALGAILAAALAVSMFERWRWIPWFGYPSSATLLVLSWWYQRHFRIGLRVCPGPATAARWLWRCAFGLGLAAAVLGAAWRPIAPNAAGELAWQHGLHLFLLVPVAEEFYFRGILLEHLRRGFGATHAIVLVTALFTVLHVPAGAGTVAAALSAVGCALVLKGGALTWAIQLHVAWNAWSQINRMPEPSQRWLWATAACAALIALGAAPRARCDASPSVLQPEPVASAPPADEREPAGELGA